MTPRMGKAKNELGCTVLANSGGFQYQETAFTVPGLAGHDFQMTFSYQSNPLRKTDPRALRGTPLGEGWMHSQSKTLALTADGHHLRYLNGYPGTSQIMWEPPTDPGVYMGEPGSFDYVVTETPSSAAGATIRRLVHGLTGVVESYVANNGLLDTIRYPDGLTMTYYYLETSPDPGQPGHGPCYVSEVVDTKGQVQAFHYETITLRKDLNNVGGLGDPQTVERLSEVISSDGRSVHFSYCMDDLPGSCEKGVLNTYTAVPISGAPGNSFPTRTYQYAYTGVRGKGGLENVTQPDGTVSIQNTYKTVPGLGNRVWDEKCGGSEYTFLWSQPTDPSFCAGNVTVVDPELHKADYEVHPIGFVTKVTEWTGHFDRSGNFHDRTDLRPAGNNPGGVPANYITKFEYDQFGDGLVTRQTNADLSSIEYTYHNPKIDPQLNYVPKEEWVKRGRLEQKTLHSAPRNPIADVTTKYSYEPCFSQVQTVIDPMNQVTTTVYTHQSYNGGQISTPAAHLNASGDWVCLPPWQVTGGLASEVHYPKVTKFPQGLAAPGMTQEAVDTTEYNSFSQPSRKINAEQKVTTFEYYDGGKGFLKSTTVDDGGLNLLTEYVRDARGNAIETTDPVGVISIAKFNELNEPYAVYPAARLSFRARSGLFPQPAVNTITYYDILGRKWQVNNALTNPDTPDQDNPSGFPFPSPRAVSTTWTYDQRGNVLTMLQENGKRVEPHSYAYDHLDHRTSETLPSQKEITETTYDELGRTLDTTVAPGTSLEATTERDYYSNTQQVEYARDPRFTPPTTLGAPRLYETRTLIDGLGRDIGTVAPLPLVSQVDKLLDARGMVYDETVTGNAQDGSTVKVKLSHKTNQYDERGRLFEVYSDVFDPLNPSVPTQTVSAKTLLDRLGRAVNTRDANGNDTKTNYDGAGRVRLVTLPTGDSTETEYDGNGRPTVVMTHERSSGKSFSTRTDYDSLGRAVKITDNLGQFSFQDFDSQGNLVSSVDPRGNKTSHFYDGTRHEVRSETILTASGDAQMNGPWTPDPSQGLNGKLVRETTYDIDGNLKTYSVGGVLGHTDSYNARNALDRRQYPDGTTEKFSYDLAGNVQAMTQRDGTVITHGYDAANHLTSSAVTSNPNNRPGTTQQWFHYDGAGRKVGDFDNNDPSTRADDFYHSYHYDSLGRLLGSSENWGPLWFRPRTTSATYDANGNVLKLTYPSGRQIGFTWTALNQIKTITDSSSGASIATFNYKGPAHYQSISYGNTLESFDYDDLNRVTGITHQLRGSTLRLKYAYDRASNVASEDIAFAPVTDSLTAYQYDSANQLLKRAPTVRNGAASVVQVPEAFTLDGRGNRKNSQVGTTSTSWTADDLNEYTKVGSDTLTWDDNGNLESYGPRQYAFDAFGRLRSVTGAFGPQGQYWYDANGLRVRAKDSFNINSSIDFVYWNGRLIERRIGLIGPVPAFTETYVTGNRPLQILQVTTFKQTYYPHRNGIGSTLALSDDSGALIESYDYDSAGNVAIKDPTGAALGSSRVRNTHLFAGLDYDPFTELYNNVARWYSPTLGRFISADPSELWQPTLYAYASNNPVRFVDPLGLQDGEKDDARIHLGPPFGSSGEGGDTPLPRPLPLSSDDDQTEDQKNMKKLAHTMSPSGDIRTDDKKADPKLTPFPGVNKDFVNGVQKGLQKTASDLRKDDPGGPTDVPKASDARVLKDGPSGELKVLHGNDYVKVGLDNLTPQAPVGKEIADTLFGPGASSAFTEAAMKGDVVGTLENVFTPIGAVGAIGLGGYIGGEAAAGGKIQASGLSVGPLTFSGSYSFGSVDHSAAFPTRFEGAVMVNAGDLMKTFSK